MATSPALTAERLRAILAYDPATGTFVWVVRTGPRCVIGSVAGTIDRKGYRRIRIDGVRHAAHRLAWLYVTGEWPRDQIDHRNRDRADNRFENLRPASNGQNQFNQVTVRTRELGRLKGTHLTRSGTYQAIVGFKGKKKYLGRFKTEAEAHRAYQVAVEELAGEFARP